MSTSTDREPCRLCGRQPKPVGRACWECVHGGNLYAPSLYGPTNDPSGTGWDAHMRDWDAAYAARAKETEAQVAPDQVDAALDKLAEGGHVWNGVNPRELRGEPADRWHNCEKHHISWREPHFEHGCPYCNAAAYEPADWWRTGTCGECAWGMQGRVYEPPEMDYCRQQRCAVDSNSPACPAGVRR